jgi:BRK domain
MDNFICKADAVAERTSSFTACHDDRPLTIYPSPAADPDEPEGEAGIATAPPLSIDEQRVPLWHTIEKRKLAGNNAPKRRNVTQFITDNPQWEIYDPAIHIRSNSIDGAHGCRTRLWNTRTLKKVVGNAAPLRQNLERHLAKNPHLECYSGQDLQIHSEAIIDLPPMETTQIEDYFGVNRFFG